MSEGEPGFFRSRWVEPPAGVDRAASTALAPGFRAAGAACGLKASGGTDVGIVACDAAEVTSALLLTRNAAAAAPIRVCRDRCDGRRSAPPSSTRATPTPRPGEQGYADAVAMQERCAAALGIEPAAVAVAETGHDRGPARHRQGARRHRHAPRRRCGPTGGQDFSDGDHDHRPRARSAAACSAGGVTLSAQAKGAGMIEPGFATMLCFVQTDAVVADPDAALRAAVDDSFERITVDGQMSTNDTVLLQASGASGRAAAGGPARRGAAAAGAGDRRRRRGRHHGSGGSRSAGRPDAARPSGRPRDRELAAGQDGALRTRPELGPDRPGGRPGAGRSRARGARRRSHRCRRGRRRELAEAELSRRSRPRRRERAHVFFSDLTHEYIKINAEYTT